MNIKQEIKQKGFRNEYQKALINMLYTHNFLKGKMSDTFKKFDITRQQFNVLRILRGQHPKPVTINTIKDRMLDKMSDASRIVIRLKKKNLINSQQGKCDRRSTEVNITTQGLNLLKNMDSNVEDFDDLFSNLTNSEAKTLNTLLDKIRG
ncbi:MAG: MarR family transcriptional regulator [Saprospiraceae bacterium]|nr:MarR family transcriptional regulator [Saprospiraceae bacterium]